MDASSFDAYQRLVASGNLGKAQRQVLVALLSGGPQTGREINARLGMQDAHKRLSELERKRLVDSPNETVCSISGRKSKVWRVSMKNIPSNPVNHISTDPDVKRARLGIRSVLDVKTGPTIYAAMVDGLPLKASASQNKILEYCKSTGCQMVKFRPERIWEFHNPKTSGKVFDETPELFPGFEG